MKTVEEIKKLILNREKYWIVAYNSIHEGYNSIDSIQEPIVINPNQVDINFQL